MKRNEIKTIITNAIIDYSHDNYVPEDGLVDCILSVIEKAGMRPPRRDSEEVAKEMGEVSSQAFYRSSSEKEYEKRVNDWEPENEEK